MAKEGQKGGVETEGTGRQKMKYEGERDEWEEMIRRVKKRIWERGRWGNEWNRGWGEGEKKSSRGRSMDDKQVRSVGVEGANM